MERINSQYILTLWVFAQSANLEQPSGQGGVGWGVVGVCVVKERAGSINGHPILVIATEHMI